MSESVDLPWYESGKTYLVSGDALNEIISVINRNRIRITDEGLLKTDQEDDDGTWISADQDAIQNLIDNSTSDFLTEEDVTTLINDALASLPTTDLEVCIDGSPGTVTVLTPP